MNRINRRRFLEQLTAAAAVCGVPRALWGSADARSPHVKFPTEPKERIAIASYPFREFIRGKHEAGAGRAKMEIKQFAAYVGEKLGVSKIEPWSEHFLSLEPAYLEEIRGEVEKAGGAIVDIAADGGYSPYAKSREEREQAIAFSKRWIDGAAALGSPSVRTNIPAARDAKPDVTVLAESLKVAVEYGERKNVVVHLENDNPVSEDPFFLVKVIERVKSPWLRALPDFGNSVGALPEADAYRGIDEMFAHAYGISHVKNASETRDGKLVPVDMEKTFGIAAKHGYKGYFSMEWDSPGDPYAGTKELMETTVKALTAQQRRRS